MSGIAVGTKYDHVTIEMPFARLDGNGPRAERDFPPAISMGQANSATVYWGFF